MLLEGEYRPVDVEALFKRFEGKCFKTGRQLDIKDGRGWAIDHILPSRYLYPLTTENAALLSREANDQKRDRWPSDFYTNSELARLAALTGADLTLLTSKTPIINPKIDVDACVTRALRVRERSDFHKRVVQLKQLIGNYGLIKHLSPRNKKLLGFG